MSSLTFLLNCSYLSLLSLFFCLSPSLKIPSRVALKETLKMPILAASAASTAVAAAAAAIMLAVTRTAATQREMV